MPISVARFALETESRDMPFSARHAAARLLLDTLGVLCAATPMRAGCIARSTALALYGSADQSAVARIPFDGRRASVAGAAWAAASATDNLDAHDGYNPTKGHIGVAVVPALLAMAQTVARPLSGADALAALIVGYEVAGRAGIALHNTVSDYHTSGAWNALGVAALAARLKQQSQTALREALGIAEFHGPRSQMMREIDNPSMLHDGSGQGALIGLSAYVMAENGFLGAPAITVEADDVQSIWADLGDVWQVERQYIKPYPICRWAHAALDGMAALVREHGLSVDDIARVRVETFNEAAQLFAGMPETTSEAQYSLRFALATLVVHGEIGPAQIDGAALSDPRVAALLARIDVAEHARFSTRFPADRMASVSVETQAGAHLSSGDLHARGGPEGPLSENEVSEKFHRFAAPVLGTSRAEAIERATLALTDDDSTFDGLLDLVLAPIGEPQ